MAKQTIEIVLTATRDGGPSAKRMTGSYEAGVSPKGKAKTKAVLKK